MLPLFNNIIFSFLEGKQHYNIIFLWCLTLDFSGSGACSASCAAATGPFSSSSILVKASENSVKSNDFF